MKTLIFFIYLSLLLIINSHTYGNIIKIVLKIEDTLITNQDIDLESKILRILNPQLKSLDNKQVNLIGKNSLIREKIKQKEIEKYYQVDYETNSVDPFIEKIFMNLNFKNIGEFKKYLMNSQISYDYLKKKLVLEKSWNQLIFDRYKNKIKINKEDFEKKYTKSTKNIEKENSFLLYEIVFLEKEKIKFEKKLNEILSSIKNIGFKQTASIFSQSNSAQESGKVGWVKTSQLSELILENINTLEKNQFSNPISTAGGTLILYIEDIKEISTQIINKEAEISKMIKLERDRQLNEFSIIRYKKLENNSYVKEF